MLSSGPSSAPPAFWRRLAALVAAAVTIVASAAGPGTPPAVLTSIGEIRSLSPEQAAAALPVNVRGIITRCTPYELFIQNGSDAIFIWQRGGEHKGLSLGALVEITGETHPGHLFPVIRHPTITVLGLPGLPEPQRLPANELTAMRHDCQWVEVRGVVRTVEHLSNRSLQLGVFYDGTVLRVHIHQPAPNRSANLLGATVRLRGVISGAKTPQRTIVEPVLWVVDTPETLAVLAPGPADLFSIPLRTVQMLKEPDATARSGEMLRLQGTVTGQPAPRLVYLRDGDHGLEIRLPQPVTFAAGDRIEAVGFPEMGLVQPVLHAAVARRIGADPAPLPLRVRAKELLDFAHEAQLIEVSGELREVFRHNDGLSLVLAEDGTAFSVDLFAAPQADDPPLPPVGSRIALVGICLIERVTPPNVFQIVSPATARVQLRSLADLRVLSRPPWWTPTRLFIAIAVLSLCALGALGWVWTLNRRVQAQTHIILGNAQKQAALEERNRIAREFHDTLEQQLAGATILLDAVDTILEQPQRARASLNTARAMLRHSLDEAQQAVADLRSNDLIERDLGPLIEQAVHQRLHATGIKPEFRRSGDWPDLDTMVKQHLLRIVQESVTNAAKHAAPRRITVSLQAARDQVELEVADDGCGFDVTERLHGPGRFGLIGMQERAEKIGARLTIRSAPAAGTTLTVILPLVEPVPV